MHEVLASALPDKPVLSSDGRELGIVHNLTMDTRTGKLNTLLVEPDGDGFDELEPTDEGDIRIPAGRISGFDDYLVVTVLNQCYQMEPARFGTDHEHQ